VRGNFGTLPALPYGLTAVHRGPASLTVAVRTTGFESRPLGQVSIAVRASSVSEVLRLASPGKPSNPSSP
jgi:hypothetical protein